MITKCYRSEKPIDLQPILKRDLKIEGVEFAEIAYMGNEHDHILVKVNSELPKKSIIEKLHEIAGDDVRYIR
jgi:hypothetical protein